MRRDVVDLRPLEPHREETVLGRIAIKDSALYSCRKNIWGWSPLDFRRRHQRAIHRLGHRHARGLFLGTTHGHLLPRSPKLRGTKSPSAQIAATSGWSWRCS